MLRKVNGLKLLCKSVLVMVQFPMFGCSTTENLAVQIWTSMSALMTQFPDVTLHKVKVHETDKNVVCYRGELMD